MEEEKEKSGGHISKTDLFKMLAVAIFFDVILALIQLIPIAGSVASAVFNVVPFMIFFIWYKLLGISFANPKKSISFFGVGVIEFIPIINILPTWTLEIVYMYVLQKKDVILEKAAGIVGGAAGATGLASTAAKAVGAKNIGKSLEQTSENLKNKENEIRSNISPLRDPKGGMVGNEIRRPNQAKAETKTTKETEKTPDNVIPFPTKEEETPSNVVPFGNATKEEPHNKDWIFPNRKVG